MAGCIIYVNIPYSVNDASHVEMLCVCMCERGGGGGGEGEDKHNNNIIITMSL